MKTRKENLPEPFPLNIRHFVNHRSGGRSHWHEEIELQYVVGGSAHPTCNLESIPLKVGDILFVNSNELHSGNNMPKSGEFYCFHLNKAFFSNRIGEEHIVFENFIRDERCAELLDKVIECHRRNDFKSRINAAGYLYDFFSLLAEDHVKRVTSESEFKKSFKRCDNFNDIVKYIEDNSAERLTVGNIAEHFFISPSYLSHLFKKRSGKSVMEFVGEVRINKARLYLERENMSVGEIAGLVGFDDFNYFSRKFRQICGETPTSYRTKYR